MPEFPRQGYGRRLGPGIYDDGQGEIHVDADEVCAHFGVPPNPENVATLVEAVQQAATELYGGRVPVDVEAAPDA